MYKEYKELEHRPYELPASPWLMTQVWRDLLFMHFPVSADIVKSYIPGDLELDTFENKAWISIIPFRITNMRARGLPLIPYLNAYLELNVRTYVTYKGIPGIYFFSLDADHLLAVAGARALAGLPYKRAAMSFHKNEKDMEVVSQRIGSTETLKVSYRSGSILFEPLPGSIDHWLLERYCLYTYWGGSLLRGDIHHDKWKVTAAEASIHTNTMTSFSLSQPPLLHYSNRRRFFFYPLKKV